MYLPAVEQAETAGPQGDLIRGMRQAGITIPQILHLIAFKPQNTDHLGRFAEGVMRGPSPLAPGWRELIAAYTSKLNHCRF
jgi:alkylhydroperoxidase family enzyme